VIDDVVFSDSFVNGALKLKKKFHGVKFNTVAERITGLIPAGSKGVNHGEWTELSFNPRHFCSSGLAIGIATDGVVVLLTVTIEK
jgi:hypothetical protein